MGDEAVKVATALVGMDAADEFVALARDAAATQAEFVFSAFD